MDLEFYHSIKTRFTAYLFQPPPVVENISFLNAFLAVWFDTFAFSNYRGKLNIEDLPGITYHQRLEYLAPLFTKNWKKEYVMKPC